MKRWLFLALVCLVWNPSAHAADEFYINNGIVTFPPQIDALNFVNNGIFSISTELAVPLYPSQPSPPFETSNTRNFTNTGSLFGTPGWRFDYGPASDGQRQWAANFVNRGDGVNNGVVQSTDPAALIFILGPNIAAVQPSYLFVSATNIVSQGLLSVGANGSLELKGASVNLSRSGVEVQPIVPQGSFNIFPPFFPPNTFFPDVAIDDLYWAQTNATFNSRSIWNGQIASDPISGIRVSNPITDTFTNRFEGITVTVTNIDTNGMAYQTNIDVPTNIVRQAVFVGATNENMEVEIRFFDSTIPTNELKTVSVGVSVGSTNLATTFPETTMLYFVDYLASETNRGVLTNLVSTTTLRPATYLVQRLVPFEFFFGVPGFGPPPNNFLYSQSFSNNAVLGEFAAYGMFVNNTVSQPPAVPAGGVTNLPGRVRIVADNLNLNKTRLRGEGQIGIQANHLIGSTNAVVDCENLLFNLGSTNGNLHVLNLAKESVARLKGNAFAWSGLWTNTLFIVLTNYAIDTNMMTTNRMDITNAATVLLHTLILDATRLLTEQPVTVHDFVTHSTNVLFSDAMTIVKSFLIDGESFTLDGSIRLSGAIEDWRYTLAPNLLFLTNNGILSIPNEAHFGDDRLAPYSTFVNRGTNTATGFTIRSSYFENSGTLSAGSGGVYVQTSTGKIEDGTINSVADVQIFANDLKLDRGVISTSSRLDLTVTDSLLDTGGGSGNRFSCRGGLRLLVKPRTSDLIGTSIISRAPQFAEVGHVWAGQDRGSAMAGFSNNVALGQLKLSPEGFDALFTFSGTSVSNALYVDLLDLTSLTDLNNQLQINPNLVIYFAAARLNSAPPNLPSGVAQLPEEYLDGQFDGHLRWVREFAGPNSSVDVLINGQTVQVNQALRNSKIIDSDGDGIPNFYDFTPFDGPGLIVTAALAQTNQPPSTVVLISWEAAPATAYNLQSAANILRPDWQTLLRVTNNSPSNKIITISDTNISAGVVQRFYRVGYGN